MLSPDVVLSTEDPRPPPRHPLTKPKTLAEEAQDRLPSTPNSVTPPGEDSTDSSLMEDDGLPKPRRRRIHLPFGKKAKTPA